MQIHFIKEFPWGKKSHFVEKIWAGFALNDFLWNNRDGCWSTEHYKELWPYGDDPDGTSSWWRPFMKAKPKIHTIREDLKERWKAGKIIHFEQWTSKPYNSKCYHFAPLIPCVSTQKIEIKYNRGGGVNVFIDGKFFYYQTEWGLEWDKETKENMFKLAINDGFDSISDFFKWFNKDYSGKIIHWTDCRY